MKKHVLIYGLAAGTLIAGLRVVEYQYLVIEHSVEIYGGLIAAIFAAVGIWLGLTMTGRRATVVIREIERPASSVVALAATPATPAAFRPSAAAFVRDARAIETLGVTPRELEMLELMAAGLSTREIAERSFISENTVKTHATRLFAKLGARRRTQAVQIGKERGLLP